ncbi:MAG: response regulator [Clostridia bacterium]|nr:response regulator [Clostridia bacterium]
MYRVLIVEDDPMVAMINEQYIGRHKHFEIAGICNNGKSALEFFQNDVADLVILDVFMPVMDGFETLRQLRKMQIAVDVIMVTAANDRDSLEEALHLGVVDYLIKPFTFDRFQIALDKFILQTDALKDLQTLNQKNIDFVIESSRKKGESLHPKGIQEKTLHLIFEYLQSHEDTWLTGDAIAEATGLTGVTVRRYMNYLAKSGKIVEEMNYETGGRPCMLYQIAK